MFVYGKGVMQPANDVEREDCERQYETAVLHAYGATVTLEVTTPGLDLHQSSIEPLGRQRRNQWPPFVTL